MGEHPRDGPPVFEVKSPTKFQMTQSIKREPSTRHQRLLLRVDDNPDDLLLFQLAWEKAGLTNPIRFTATRKEAVDYLEGRGKYADRQAFPLPAVIVIDMRLPDGNASEFLRWIRVHPTLSKLVVIVLSGTAHQEDVNEAYRLGANSFLLKSANSRHLQHTVNLIQSYWLNQNFMPGLCVRAEVSFTIDDLRLTREGEREAGQGHFQTWIPR